VTPTVAPVPAATMRSGSVRLAPGLVTLTGRIACTSWPGWSLSARKSNPSDTYAAMIGWMSAGMAKPLAVSQSLSAVGLVDCSCTVSYGPTTDCEITVTPVSPPPLLEPLPPLVAVGVPNSAHEHEGQAGRFGDSMVVCVAESSDANTMSALSPTCTCPWMGSTQANDVGLPWYSISS